MATVVTMSLPSLRKAAEAEALILHRRQCQDRQIEASPIIDDEAPVLDKVADSLDGDCWACK